MTVLVVGVPAVIVLVFLETVVVGFVVGGVDRPERQPGVAVRPVVMVIVRPEAVSVLDGAVHCSILPRVGSRPVGAGRNGSFSGGS